MGNCLIAAFFAVLGATAVPTVHAEETGAAPPSSSTHVSRERALQLAQVAAKDHGYNLAKYELSTFGNEVDEGNNEWLFVYNCSPAPPPPGCFFMVAVNRSTGSAEVYPGE